MCGDHFLFAFIQQMQKSRLYSTTRCQATEPRLPHKGHGVNHKSVGLTATSNNDVSTALKRLQNVSSAKQKTCQSSTHRTAPQMKYLSASILSSGTGTS